jgi:rhodanese-related sulfurtransferase
VDVREPYEWAEGRIEGSIHIPLRELKQRYGEIPGDRTVIVVCQVGQRSELAAGFLAQNGFEAFNLEGGLEAWIAEGLPLEAPGQVAEGFAQVFPP